MYYIPVWLQAFPDNAARREVETLAAICVNEGCTWKGSIKEYEVSYSLSILSSGHIHQPFLPIYAVFKKI